jgi:hypothetical protein
MDLGGGLTMPTIKERTVGFAGMVYDILAEFESLAAENAALRADAERWRHVRSLMTHKHAGPNIGWTLSMLLPGDDPDSAIDAARAKGE